MLIIYYKRWFQETILGRTEEGRQANRMVCCWVGHHCGQLRYNLTGFPESLCRMHFTHFFSRTEQTNLSSGSGPPLASSQFMGYYLFFLLGCVCTECQEDFSKCSTLKWLSLPRENRKRLVVQLRQCVFRLQLPEAVLSNGQNRK